jgi:hypothetical protein
VHLGPFHQLEGDSRLAQSILQTLERLLDRRPLVDIAEVDVRRADERLDPVGSRDPAQLDGVFLGAGAVVDPRQDVRMQVDQKLPRRL